MEISRDLFSLDGKNAIVTGGSRGIGKAICLGLAAFGANVGIIGMSEKTSDTVKTIEEMGRKALFKQASVADIAATKRAVDEIWQEFGSIDILVNNAGVGTTAAAEAVTEGEWDQVIGVNLEGLFFTSQAVCRKMIDQGFGGRIINIGSIFGIVGSELGASVYHAAKGAVVNLTRALACEWAKYDITVNCIGPGFITTDMTRELRENPELARVLEDRHAMGRFGEPEEMVGAVIFLASNAATFVTGENLFVDGGYTAW